MLTYAPQIKRLAQFTPAEVDRMSVGDARWVLESVPAVVRLLAEIELAGGDAWAEARAVAHELGEVRRACA